MTTTTSIQTIADVASSARHAAEIASMAVSSGLLQITRPEQAVLLILRGADLGMTPMQSLYAFHVINNRPSLSSDAMVALIRRSGLCESWHIVESTATRCTIATKRVGDIEATSITWTAEDAVRAGLPMTILASFRNG